jgi:mRNA-degrading endonuclease RelE of RelBE toxin-antitoxin system
VPGDVEEPYRLVVSPTASRALGTGLPAAVAAAVLEFITGDLLREPRRVGKPLLRELAGTWSARRGTYRVLYDVDDDARTVRVLDVQHRRDVYRRR